MKISGKLEAFTIIEVTISMVLAAISIVLAYTSYRVVSSSYSQFDSKNKKLSEFVLADKLLKKDVSFCTKMIRADQGLSLIMQEGEIRYTFSPEYILRNQYNLRTDTLFVRSAQLKSLFKQQEVLIGDAMDTFSFIAELENNSIPFKYAKEYSSEELIELDDRNNLHNVDSITRE